MVCVKIDKIDDMLAIKIPKDICDELKLSDKSTLFMEVSNDSLLLQKQPYKDLESMCADINDNNLNVDSEWLESRVGREW